MISIDTEHVQTPTVTNTLLLTSCYTARIVFYDLLITFSIKGGPQMNSHHEKILNDLDIRGKRHYCLLPGRNVVGKVSALVNGHRLVVTITKTQFGYFAAVNYDGRIYHKWSRSASDAVKALGAELKEKLR